MPRRRGAAEAGAIVIEIDGLDGRLALYESAPLPLTADLPPGVDRLFQRMRESVWIDPLEAEARLEPEIRFEPDLWIVEVEDRDGEPEIGLAR